MHAHFWYVLTDIFMGQSYGTIISIKRHVFLSEGSHYIGWPIRVYRPGVFNGEVPPE